MATDTGTTDTTSTTDDDDGKGGTDTGADSTTSTDDDHEDEDPDEGDAEKWKALARKHERESKRRAKELDEIKSKNQTDAEKAIEKARQEGRDEATAAAVKANVETILDVVATEKLADPSYVRMIDDDDREDFVNEDGKVDRKAITKAVDALVKKHPELKKNGSAALPGSGGSRESSAGFDMNTEIRRRAGRG